MATVSQRIHRSNRYRPLMQQRFSPGVMPKLPVIKPKELITIARSLGFTEETIHGSHHIPDAFSECVRISTNV